MSVHTYAILGEQKDSDEFRDLSFQAALLYSTSVLVPPPAALNTALDAIFLAASESFSFLRQSLLRVCSAASPTWRRPTKRGRKREQQKDATWYALYASVS